MKCYNLFSKKTKKKENIINLSSTEFADRVLNTKY